jgi:hypothetical protein
MKTVARSVLAGLPQGRLAEPEERCYQDHSH